MGKSKMYLIGTIRSPKQIKNVLGYRFYSDGRVKDFAPSAVASLKLENYEPMNFAVLGQNVSSTNGSMDRYPVMSAEDRKVLKNSLVVISKLKDGFRMVNVAGQMAVLTDKEALAYSKLMGVANGKVTKISGTETLSSISGVYPEEDVTVAQLRGMVSKAIKPVAGGKVEEKKTDNITSLADAFERAFGKHRADVIMYLMETRGIDPEVIAESMKVSDVGVALAGLMVYSSDCKDVKLRDLLMKQHRTGKVVNKQALDVIDYMTTRGVNFDSYWDAGPIAGCTLEELKCDVSYFKITNAVLNYTAKVGKFNGLEVERVGEDEIRVAHNGAEVYVQYPIVGYDPLHNVLVLDKDGEPSIKRMRD